MLDLIFQASLLVQGVILMLVAFSVVSWTIIASKWREFARAEKDSEAFLQVYHEEPFGTAHDAAKHLDRSPLAIVFLAGCDQIRRLARSSGQRALRELDPEQARTVAKQLGWASADEARRLERGLTFLATTGSATPFIGLFGTVIGIIDAFDSIGRSGSASLSVVAPGIAEALIATAMGLIAAIPATIFYNYYVARHAVIGQSLELFVAEFESDLLTLTAGSDGSVRGG